MRTTWKLQINNTLTGSLKDNATGTKGVNIAVLLSRN